MHEYGGITSYRSTFQEFGTLTNYIKLFILKYKQYYAWHFVHLFIALGFVTTLLTDQCLQILCYVYVQEHANKLVEVANLACSMSNNEEGVKMVRMAAAQIESLCPQVSTEHTEKWSAKIRTKCSAAIAMLNPVCTTAVFLVIQQII